MLKRLWQILGPLICACLLAVVMIAFYPEHIGFSDISAKKDAVDLSEFSFKSKAKKLRALEDEKNHFVPFFGSSEWSRFDLTHPSVLAEAYGRNYRPYLLGKMGAASFTHFFGSQDITSALKEGQAVYFVSPQWFDSDGADPDAFRNYLSSGQILEFLLHQTGSTYDVYAAKRVLTLNPDNAFKKYLTKVVDGEALSSSDMYWLKLQSTIIDKEDNFYSQFRVDSHNYEKVMREASNLPKEFSYDKLQELAIEDAKKVTTNNEFHIRNGFYTERIASRKNDLKNSQKNYDYTKSTEYQDFQLMLERFAETKTNVMFVIPPVNGAWVKHTGLSEDMYARAVSKIKYQLQSQGFTNIADFSKEGATPYFMEDTIHIGWTGWLAMDKQVEPFLTQKLASPDYQINDKFLTTDWANYTGNPEEFASAKK